MIINFTAAGRKLWVTGTKDDYLKGLQGWNADDCPVVRTIKDLPLGAIIFDVGANIGATALAMAAHRPDCQIYAFEPVPSNATCLRMNLGLNRIENVKVIQAGISDRPGELKITDNGPWSTIGDGNGTVTVEVVTLDSFVRMPVDFVKVDTEGHEPHVFAGARELFYRHKPLVLTEFSSWWYVLKGYNPVAFSTAIANAFDVLGIYQQDDTFEKAEGWAANSIAWINMVRHQCISDVLLRARDRLPTFDEMVYPAAVVAIKQAAERLLPA
jgi:FkbM family methyltransferase